MEVLRTAVVGEPNLSRLDAKRRSPGHPLGCSHAIAHSGQSIEAEFVVEPTDVDHVSGKQQAIKTKQWAYPQTAVVLNFSTRCHTTMFPRSSIRKPARLRRFPLPGNRLQPCLGGQTTGGRTIIGPFKPINFLLKLRKAHAIHSGQGHRGKTKRGLAAFQPDAERFGKGRIALIGEAERMLSRQLARKGSICRCAT